MPRSPRMTILFGVDLEDIRHRFAGGVSFTSAVPHLTHQLLDFLAQRQVSATFFADGRTVEEFPSLIQEIAASGHEIASHTYSHQPLYEMGVEAFRRDLARSLEVTHRAAGIAMTGFRAPFFSATPQTKWIYGVLKEFGFSYSSSVLDARWPVAGWPGFRKDHFSTTPDLQEPAGFAVIDGVIEIPITSARIGSIGFPVAGGIYCRLLPAPVLRLLWSRWLQSQGYISTYIHPYDIDLAEQKFRHPEFERNAFLNYLMHVGRAGLLAKFADLIARADATCRYDQFVKNLQQPTQDTAVDRHVA